MSMWKNALVLKDICQNIQFMFASNCQCNRGKNTYGEKEQEWQKILKCGKMLIIGEYR